ncbi:hypothetical protein [Thermosyntropha sp.]|uniref:hypothetical protein n=1 Tax=Thermosyntropha sp. TaxID=2740820 RepID=UPI0025CD2C98|nr:hypothetical protein [Thermosyntropha sp.]MBO8159530.1 hypothetical protein [Thermosyntropha sp.]
MSKKIKIRVRFDFLGKAKQGKLFGGKTSEQVAEEIRQNKVLLMRNVPVQGITIEDIDMSQEVYSVHDEFTGKILAYAPVIVTFYADSLEDVIKFTMKEEFRTIEVLEPEEMVLSKLEMGRILLRISEELANYKVYLERKIDSWK